MQTTERYILDIRPEHVGLFAELCLQLEAGFKKQESAEEVEQLTPEARADIMEGIRDIEEGRFITLEEFKKEFDL